jgi:hypothetical protein
MSGNDNPLIKAHFAVVSALQGLDQEEQRRVIESVAALFNLQGVSPSGFIQSASVEPVAGDAGASRPDKQPQQGGKPLSLVEFLDEKQPTTNQQRIACFAYYREKIEGKGDKFSSRDLAAYFPLAKLPNPGPNYARDYKGAVTAAWIHDEQANSYLTRKGEAAVEAGFGGKRASPSKKKKPGKSE